MRRAISVLSILVATVAFAGAVDFQPIPQDTVASIAPRLVEAAEKMADPPIKLQADSEKASGLYAEGAGGLLVVPRKGLKEEETKEAQEPSGAPVAYLFLYRITVAPEGKAIEASRLPIANIAGDDGQERQIAMLRLSVKKEGEEDWKLLVFGKDKKPIVSSKFRLEDKKSEHPIGIELKNVEGEKGTLVVHVHGKYAADIPLAAAR